MCEMKKDKLPLTLPLSLPVHHHTYVFEKNDVIVNLFRKPFENILDKQH